MVDGWRGFPREQMCSIEGDPGAGKTTLALQFLKAGVQAGESTLYVILAETEREVRRLAASHGWSLEGVRVVQGVLAAIRVVTRFPILRTLSWNAPLMQYSSCSRR